MGRRLMRPTDLIIAVAVALFIIIPWWLGMLEIYARLAW